MGGVFSQRNNTSELYFGGNELENERFERVVMTCTQGRK